MREDHRDMAFPPIGGLFNGVFNKYGRNPQAN
jgi:hypothetical protein